MNLEQTERKQIPENYFIVEENLMLLHSMGVVWARTCV